MQAGSYYVESSRYHASLSRYFARFGRERIEVILFDDLVANPRAVVRDLFVFLGVDSTFEVDVATPHNRAAVPRSLIANRVSAPDGELIHRVLPLPVRDTGITGRVQRMFLSARSRFPRTSGGGCLRSFATTSAKRPH